MLPCGNWRVVGGGYDHILMYVCMGLSKNKKNLKTVPFGGKGILVGRYGHMATCVKMRVILHQKHIYAHEHSSLSDL